MLPATYSRRNPSWVPGIFTDFFNDDFFGLTPAKQFASPAVNVIENEKNFQLELAAPGMAKDDFSIRVENDNELSIKLEKKNEDKKEKKNYLRHEFAYASYQQSFIIPEEVETEAISAAMNNGILTVTLPKKEPVVKTPASRRIEIQ